MENRWKTAGWLLELIVEWMLELEIECFNFSIEAADDDQKVTLKLLQNFAALIAEVFR